MTGLDLSEEWVKPDDLIIPVKSAQAFIIIPFDIEQCHFMIEGSKQQGMLAHQRSFDISTTIHITDPVIESKDCSRRVRVSTRHLLVVRFAHIRQIQTGKCDFQTGVRITVGCNRQHSICDRHPQGLSKSERNELVVDQVRGFLAIKLDYPMQRA